jgi:hypothetical protein
MIVLLTAGELVALSQKINPNVPIDTPIKLYADENKCCIKTLDDQVIAWSHRHALPEKG